MCCKFPRLCRLFLLYSRRSRPIMAAWSHSTEVKLKVLQVDISYQLKDDVGSYCDQSFTSCIYIKVICEKFRLCILCDRSERSPSDVISAFRNLVWGIKQISLLFAFILVHCLLNFKYVSLYKEYGCKLLWIIFNYSSN